MTHSAEVYTAHPVEQPDRSVEQAVSYGFLIHGGTFGFSHFSALMEHGLLPVAELAKIGIDKFSAYNNPHDVCTTMIPCQPTAFSRIRASGNAEVYAIGRGFTSDLQMAIVIDPEKIPASYTIKPVGEFPSGDFPHDTIGKITIDPGLRNRNDFWWFAETHVRVVSGQDEARGLPMTSWTGVIVAESDVTPLLSVWLDKLPPHLRLLDVKAAVSIPGKSIVLNSLMFVPTRQAQNIEV